MVSQGSNQRPPPGGCLHGNCAAVIFFVVKMIFEGKVDFLDLVLDSGASIDYGDVIFSKAELDQRAVRCSA